jgi:hypothetical protein
MDTPLMQKAAVEQQYH